MKALLKFLLCGTLIWAVPDVAQAEPLRIASGEYPPFTGSSQTDGGIVNARISQIAQAIGYEVEFEYFPWMRSLELTRGGRYFGTSYWYYNADRETDFIHVGPVVENRLVLFRRVDRDLPEWATIADLRGITIGAVTGYTYTDDFWDLAESGVLTVELAQSDAANLRKLFSGRIDAYPMSEEVGHSLIRELFSSEEAAQITIEEAPLTVNRGYLLVSRKQKNAATIASDLQTAVDTIAEVGS